MIRAAAIALGVLGVGCFDLDALRVPAGSPSDAGAEPATDADADADRGTDDAGTAPLDAGSPPQDASTPVDAGSSDAGAVASCGVVGKPCCRPDNNCTEGVCLRGTCAAFGGVHARAAACAPSCRVRNAYTAGCSCPFGFVEQGIDVMVRLCDEVGVGPGELAVCVPPGPPVAADVIGFFLQSDCSQDCLHSNPATGECTCSAGAVLREVGVGAPAPCAEDRGRLTFCEDPTRAPATWAGLWQQLGGGCDEPNPVTGDCSCPLGAIDHRVELPPNTFHLCLW